MVLGLVSHVILFLVLIVLYHMTEDLYAQPSTSKKKRRVKRKKKDERKTAKREGLLSQTKGTSILCWNLAPIQSVALYQKGSLATQEQTVC